MTQLSHCSHALTQFTHNFDTVHKHFDTVNPLLTQNFTQYTQCSHAMTLFAHTLTQFTLSSHNVHTQ